MHSGSGRQKSAVSVYVGIASLVLEGRVLCGDDDDENFLGVINPSQHVLNEIDPERSASPNATGTSTTTGNARHNRISEKLMLLRQFPGTSKDDVTVAVPVNSRDECDYERQPRLHHVASAREFQRNPRLTSISSSSSALNSSSAAASVLHEIDVDWNDISLILNGLDSLINVPSFPLKLTNATPTPTSSFRVSSASVPIAQETSSMKLFKTKLQQQEKLCSSPTSSLLSKGTSKPKQGPHCEKFLKKIGLLKVDSPAESEADHLCNHSNGSCRRWQFHLKKLLQVLSKAEDACIEVYLGPENNAILLEQWILTLTDRPSSSTMTIQALCSAIRSQMYFSQISSWIDLLKKAFIDGDLSVKDQMPSLFSHEIMQNPRLKKNLQTMQVDLDILFRIRAYDGTSYFLEKPNVHNFPDTIVSDGMAICVCLKSLPRLEKIPTLNTEKAHLNGFSCDNRIKSSSPVAGSSRHILNDRMIFSPCHEKGKHVCCKEDEEDDDESNLLITSHQEKLSTTTTDLSSSSSSSSSSSISALTHRERQLLKYKKRLMKRDKQKKKQQEATIDGKFLNTADINMSQVPLYETGSIANDKKLNDAHNKINGSAVEEEKDGNPTAIIDTISKHALKTSTQLSIATQTEFNDTTLLLSSFSSSLINTMMSKQQCDSCGNQLQCLNCDKVKLTINNNKFNDNNQMATSQLSISSTTSANSLSAATGTMIGKKSDLLLQAIQRTANAHGENGHDDVNERKLAEEKKSGVVVLRDNFNDNIFSSTKMYNKRDSLLVKADINTMSDNCDNSSTIATNNNNNIESFSTPNSESADCRLCKRQKTKHTPSMNIVGSNHNNSVVVGSSSTNYRRTMSECMVGMSPDNDDDDIFKSNEGMSSYLSSLTMHNCDDLQILSSEDDYNKIFSYGELKSYRRAFSEDVINQLPNEFENGIEKCTNDDDECILIKCHHTSKCNPSPVHKLTPNVTLQGFDRDASSMAIQSKNLNQKIPKINLSHIFNKIQQETSPQNDSGIGHETVIDFSPTSDDNVFIFNSPVKSYPPTMQLPAPRPCSSIINKRRSRHISDRSSISISEFCSDEDEEIVTATKCMPDKMQLPSSSKISSLYKKFVSKTQTAFNKFSKLPMLSTIEENLLHNRFQPKATVEGFKLLLGASGNFCPTQLTIPGQTYFYEFQGMKHLSTPYVCEFRLARKYSIPRFGTVQATLLNPQGTVVRMFFIQYDYRDMPAMSQTFVRQRVLALDEHISQKNAEQMSTSEQMKHLRYVINLRFQTGRSNRLCLHTDIKLVISRRTEFDTAAAHAKNSLESPNDLKTIIISPENPKFSSRIDRN
ncbi:hypothetical protein PVAND_012285 [Polypedilum vanderplanki]|uniref:Atos-like conserved domain-containing protein n=1 Tax=Polypedilum vanderplanki TaxID=319348 RepID=A0A9J6CL43_POLVA|nr:hypothetical protein PVAND_012285 [Polypedilum vanderplanki]